MLINEFIKTETPEKTLPKPYQFNHTYFWIFKINVAMKFRNEKSPVITQTDFSIGRSYCSRFTKIIVNIFLILSDMSSKHFTQP